MTSELFSNIKGLLLDINGVLYVGNRLLPGAADVIKALRDRDMPFRVVTNNTTESLVTLHKNLTMMGLAIKQHEIISAPYAAVLHLRKIGQPKCFLLLNDEVLPDFEEFPISETDADVVVVGDMGEGWNYRVLNRAFHLVMRGAELIALHKGRYWQWEAGLQLDIGAFVTGLEYSTEQTATLIGKPSPSFFKLALDDLGLTAGEVAMVGDDIEADIGGAQSVGLKGILVKTGKYRDALTAKSGVTPDLTLNSISELTPLLQSEP
ncbi:MAG: TIGR01458 family HAD-type hydrolase [Leptolyngbyaceae cyanobacterium MO_188.B28]|nr:TIGR01458 family HAD-type hydrolase [Leptolyngbyaceae cyanobacterium MO_188.B28]